jgi:hypothetical protein
MSRAGISVLVLALLAACEGASHVPARPERLASPAGPHTTIATGTGRLVTLSLSGWASVRVPARWPTTAYRGEPATVYFPLRFLSSSGFSGPCATGPMNPVCTTQNWFPSDWRTPAAGVIVLWSHVELPSTGPALQHQPGWRTTIDQRSAKVWSGLATSRCAAGADTESDAAVREDAHSDPGDSFEMTACFGRAATGQDRSAVRRMLRSLDIRR